MDEEILWSDRFLFDFFVRFAKVASIHHKCCICLLGLNI